MIGTDVRRLAGVILLGALAQAGCGGSSDKVAVRVEPPAKPILTVSGGFRAITLDWTNNGDATSFTVQGDLTGGGAWSDAVAGLSGIEASAVLEVSIQQFDWARASFKVVACNEGGCVDSDPVAAASAMVSSIGYVKSSNTGPNDQFGSTVALSADGTTLVVGAPYEDSAATGIGGNEVDDCPLVTKTNCAADSGAVYVYVRKGANVWEKQAYVKASNSNAADLFGSAVALSADGNTLIVGAFQEDGNATTVDGDGTNNGAGNAGAAYVFVRDAAGAWTQQAYLKAGNTNAGDLFGTAVAISGDGNTAVVGAPREDSTSIYATADLGAAYVYVRSAGAWSQQAIVRASTGNYSDLFGSSLALDAAGTVMAVGAPFEDSLATGIGGSETSNAAVDAGAVFLFVRNGVTWDQAAYVKASNTDAGDLFGSSVALDGAGVTLAVGATGEASYGTGIGADQANDTGAGAGAVYVFAKAAGLWSQQVYIKASNTGAGDGFGGAIALSDDGLSLLVGASGEDGAALGVDGDQTSEAAAGSGAAYLFKFGTTWTQSSYLKGANTGAGDGFGGAVAIGLDGSVLAVGAKLEDGNGTVVPVLDDSLNQALDSGAVYVY